MNTYLEVVMAGRSDFGLEVGSVWEKSDETAKTLDSTVVYTNIEDPKPAAWNTYYGGDSVPADHAAWKVIS